MANKTLSDVQMVWLKRAEYLALIAALVLGIGWGALAASVLSPVAVPLLLIGCLTLAWGMVLKQRIEVLSNGATAFWERAFYWGSWVAIVIVAAIALWRSLSLT